MAKMIDTYSILEAVREKRPLVHHITNWVTIYDCAQVVRSVGALPVMAHAPEEASQMASIASALVLNIGTLTEELVDAMILAGDAANRKGIPVILDAVGVGSTDMRTAAAKTLMTDIDIDIISDKKVTYRVDNGHEMMGHVVGTGCMATSVIASFAAVEKDYAKAAAAAMACFDIAGELAAKNAKGPASFKVGLIDELYRLDEKAVKSISKIE